MTQRHTYIVTLSAAPGSTRDESIRALRAALKCLLRSYGLRCVSAEPAEPSNEETTAQDEPQSPQMRVSDK